MMTREAAIERLGKLRTVGHECAHIEADEVLCDLLKALGYEDVVAAWDRIQPKWYA